MATKKEQIEARYNELRGQQKLWKDILPILSSEFGVNAVLKWAEGHTKQVRRSR